MFVPQGGYDRAITVFSPDGRLFQVEYALETVKRGTLSLGCSTSDGVLLAAEESLDKFQDEDFSRKLFGLDDHIGVALAGYVPDGRVLVDYAREFCQSHRLVYDEAPRTEIVARRISDIKQSFTQQAGVRPFGVSMIFGGVDEDRKPKIFVTDPSGSYLKFTVSVIGNRADSASHFLEERYKPDIDLETAKTLMAAAVQRSTLSQDEVKLRFLQIPSKTLKAELMGIKESTSYLEKAKELYGD
ncbi:MAG: archaeal proteasome endopeptidase complex subunit alpha [Candidatus Geothermarchaeales archaeon]